MLPDLAGCGIWGVLKQMMSTAERSPWCPRAGGGLLMGRARVKGHLGLVPGC